MVFKKERGAGGMEASGADISNESEVEAEVGFNSKHFDGLIRVHDNAADSELTYGTTSHKTLKNHTTI
jgi:hypothetical protein